MAITPNMQAFRGPSITNVNQQFQTPATTTTTTTPTVRNDDPVLVNLQNEYAVPNRRPPQHPLLNLPYGMEDLYTGTYEDLMGGGESSQSGIAGFRTNNDANLAGLFSKLNMLSTRGRSGSTGGGTEEVEGNMDPNFLAQYNPYMGQNVTSFYNGGNFSPGYYGEEGPYIAHKPGTAAYKEYVRQGVIPEGNTTFNPYTGEYLSGGEGGINRSVLSRGTYNKGGKVPQYGLGGWLKKVFGGASDAFQAVADPIGDVLNPVFDAAGNIIDPALDVASDIGSTAGGIVTDLADTAITGGLEGIKTLGHDVAMPIARGVLEPVSDLLGGLLGTKGGSDGARAAETGDINRMTKSQSPTETVLSGIKRNTSIANLKTDEKQKIKKDGDWVGDKENPFVTKNVEEELDYAAQGMKYMYENGGKQDTVPSNQQFGNPQGLYGPPPKEEVGFFGQLLDQIGKEVNDAGTYMSEEFPWDVYRTLERAEKAGIPVLSRDFTKLKKKLEDGWLSTRDAVTKGATTVWDKNMEVKKTVDDALENAWLTTRDSVSDFLGFDEGGKMAETYKNPKYNKGGTDLFKNYKAQKMKKGGKFKPHMMYDPKTGKGYMANKLQDHLDMKKKGYDHRKRNPENYPKAKAGMKRRYTNGGRF